MHRTAKVKTNVLLQEQLDYGAQWECYLKGKTFGLYQPNNK
jgi:hypothetical protein